MFYEIKNLLTSIVVQPFEMHILAKDAELIKRLKEKMQGRCLTQYGYIIRILAEDYKINEPVVQEDGCKVEIVFSAITFKPEKDEIIDCLVTMVSKQWIKGSIGHAAVFIPERNFSSKWQFKMEENAFIDNQTKFRIEEGTRLRFKCFNYQVEMNYQMRIVGSLEDDGLGPLQ